MLARRARLARAKAHLERIGRREQGRRDRPGAAPLTLAKGALHEIRAEDWRQRPAALSFALALAGTRDGPVVFLQLAHEARAEGTLFARGLEGFGVDPARVIAAFADDEKRFLWALEEAAREESLAAVIALAPRGERLCSLTATRRLALAAECSGVSPILIRTMTDAAPTAAVIRWKVEAAPSRPDADDERAPGAPRWRVFLERFRADPRLAAGAPFTAELNHDGRHVRLAQAATVPVPFFSLLGDGPGETQNPFARDRRAARSF
jgi:protein ImuA